MILKVGKKSLIFYLMMVCMVSLVHAEDDWPKMHPETYLPTHIQMIAAKAVVDDPRSLMDTYHPSQIVPPEIWSKMTWDVDEMKALWAELTGFSAPDIVGKIAPEIKPGKYTYKDLEKLPGLKALMIPEILEHYINAGGPPFAGSIKEFEIIPTRQYYYSMPIAKATKENLGKARMDEQGYIIESSWEAGMPFPRPSGKFMAQQVINNYNHKYYSWEGNYRFMGKAMGVNQKLKIDFDCDFAMDSIRLSKRSLIPPFGYYDTRSAKQGEKLALFTSVLSPRDIKGTVILTFNYEDVNKFNQSMMYVPSLRRIRKMSATDTQDPMNGQDQIYDDNDGFNQKLTPRRFPYKYEMISELREYLCPVSVDGTEYIDTKDGYVMKNVKMQRRPIYAVRMIQQDSNYVYGKRQFYLDAETMVAAFMFNYDQKGRLYRSLMAPFGFVEESGMPMEVGVPNIQRDHIDLHTTCVSVYGPPLLCDRDYFSMKNMSRSGK